MRFRPLSTTRLVHGCCVPLVFIARLFEVGPRHPRSNDLPIRLQATENARSSAPKSVTALPLLPQLAELSTGS